MFRASSLPGLQVVHQHRSAKQIHQSRMGQHKMCFPALKPDKGWMSFNSWGRPVQGVAEDGGGNSEGEQIKKQISTRRGQDQPWHIRLNHNLRCWPHCPYTGCSDLRHEFADLYRGWLAWDMGWGVIHLFLQSCVPASTHLVLYTAQATKSVCSGTSLDWAAY